jgi:hypothetical protein
MPDSPTFRHLKKGYTLHVHTAGGRKGHTLHVHRQLLMVLFLLNDIEKSYVNAGMSECGRKVSPASAFLLVVSCFSAASVYLHQDSDRYRWSRISPALPSSDKNALLEFIYAKVRRLSRHLVGHVSTVSCDIFQFCELANFLKVV